MGRIVQARLDEETERLLRRLQRRTGLSDSELVRRGLMALDRERPVGPARRVRGVGRFASGVGDLGSNPDHLEGFGRS